MDLLIFNNNCRKSQIRPIVIPEVNSTLHDKHPHCTVVLCNVCKGRVKLDSRLICIKGFWGLSIWLNVYSYVRRQSPVHWKQNIDFQSRKNRDLLHKPRCCLDWKSMFCFQWTGLSTANYTYSLLTDVGRVLNQTNFCLSAVVMTDVARDERRHCSSCCNVN